MSVDRVTIHEYEIRVYLPDGLFSSYGNELTLRPLFDTTFTGNEAEMAHWLNRWYIEVRKLPTWMCIVMPFDKAQEGIVVVPTVLLEQCLIGSKIVTTKT